MDGDKLKHHFKNGLVDAASIIIFTAIMVVSAQGSLTLYTGYYNLGKVSPDVFSAASTQFAGAISLVYMLIQTRKHYVPLEKKEETAT